MVNKSTIGVLMGAVFSNGMMEVAGSESSTDSIGNYINIESPVLIIVGIFLSIVIAFNIGFIVQWFVRLAFSFNQGTTLKYWGGIWGGFAITAILCFLLIKGAKGSTLISAETLDYIKSHTTFILLASFTAWTILFQVLIIFTRINVLTLRFSKKAKSVTATTIDLSRQDEGTGLLKHRRKR